MVLVWPVTMADVSSIARLRAHLLAAGMAGAVATARERSLWHYRLFAAGDPRALCGLEPATRWTVPELVALMAAECGVSADPAEVSGQDRIDPDRTIAALDGFAERVAVAALSRMPVLLGTGRPRRMLGFYVALASALSAAGCPVLTPADGRLVDIPTGFGVRRHRLSYVRGVALVRAVGPPAPEGAGHGAHSHSPLPLRTALSAAVSEGGRLPELVLGDHGWACAAGQLGIDAVGTANTDDPALFVGKAEGRVAVAVPLDDSVSPAMCRPVTRYVLGRARLSR